MRVSRTALVLSARVGVGSFAAAFAFAAAAVGFGVAGVFLGASLGARKALMNDRMFWLARGT